MKMTREMSEKERTRTHKIQRGGCTEKFNLRPIRNYELVFWRDEGNEKREINKVVDDAGSVIFFNTRQVWNVYFFTHGRNMWNCEWKNLVLRLHEKDFARIFGEVNVE